MLPSTPFLAAKCYWPGVTEQSLDLAARRAGAHCVGSILFRDDELALCVFDARSSAVVRRTAELAGIPCERVMDALWLPNPHQEVTAP
jgi:hypothetical protein